MSHYSPSFLFKSTQNLAFLPHLLLLHPVYPESLSFLILFSSNPLKTLSIVHFTPLLVPLSHYSPSFLFKSTQNLAFLPHLLLLHPVYPESLSFLILFSSNPLKTLSIVHFTPLLVPLSHYSPSFLFKSTQNLAFLPHLLLLHPVYPESLSFLILFSSNPLKTLSIVHFTPLLVPLSHYSPSFPLQIHSKPCFPYSSTPPSPSITSVTRFSFFSLPNPLKNLSIVPFTLLLVRGTHYSTLFYLYLLSKPCFHPSQSPYFTLYYLSHSLFFLFLFKYTQNLLIHCSLYPTAIPLDALFSFFSSSNPLKTLLSLLIYSSFTLYYLSHSLFFLFPSKSTQKLVHCSLYTTSSTLDALFYTLLPVLAFKTLLSPFSITLFHPLLPQSLAFLSFPLQIHSKPSDPLFSLPHCYPLGRTILLLFLFKSTQNLAFLTHLLLLHPLLPQSLAFLSFPFQIHSKTCPLFPLHYF